MNKSQCSGTLRGFSPEQFTRHWRFYHAAQKIKGNANKPPAELIKIAVAREKQIEQQLMLRKEEWEKRSPLCSCQEN